MRLLFKYGLVIIFVLCGLYYFPNMRTVWWDKGTRPVYYGTSGKVTPGNIAAANVNVSRSPAMLRGVDEATLIGPLATWGRVTLLNDRCNQANQLPQRQNLSQLLQQGGKIIRYSNKFIFCNIPKTGSSFLGHFFINRHSHHITISQFLQNYTDKYSGLTRIIFVREPFSRLVSGYISKLFYVFIEWFRFTYNASKRYRVTPSCGADLTFRELIKYVINRLEKHSTVNRHWKPHSDRCLPCHVRYNFIGKLRTANDDVQMVIDKFNLTVTETGKEYWREYQNGDIHEYVSRAFVANNCTTLPQALERMWVAFQMRAVISHTAHFPYADIISNKYPDKESLYAMILKTREQFPVTSETKTWVKKVVLRNAFSRIDADDIEKIRKLYYNDFYLYGYDMYPDFLTDKIPHTIDGWEPFKLKL